MSQNKIERFGPVALTNTLTTNLIHPADAGANGVGYTATASVLYLTRARIVNKTAGAVTCSFWLGATGANVSGTEVIAQATSVAANSYLDWFGRLRVTNTDFLVGGASANTSLTLEAEGEVALA